MLGNTVLIKLPLFKQVLNCIRPITRELQEHYWSATGLFLSWTSFKHIMPIWSWDCSQWVSQWQWRQYKSTSQLLENTDAGTWVSQTFHPCNKHLGEIVPGSSWFQRARLSTEAHIMVARKQKEEAGKETAGLVPAVAFSFPPFILVRFPVYRVVPYIWGGLTP